MKDAEFKTVTVCLKIFVVCMALYAILTLVQIGLLLAAASC